MLKTILRCIRVEAEHDYLDVRFQEVELRINMALLMPGEYGLFETGKTYKVTITERVNNEDA
jgi:hypothetical protein